LSFLKLEVDHANFFLFGANSLFSILQSVLLNVALFIVNAELIIPINKLNTHVVSTFTGHLILIDKVIHFLLKRVDNQIQLIALIYLLTDDIFLCLIDGNSLIEVSTQFIAEINLLLELMLDVNE
jgi:hypothetical protein